RQRFFSPLQSLPWSKSEQLYRAGSPYRRAPRLGLVQRKPSSLARQSRRYEASDVPPFVLLSYHLRQPVQNENGNTQEMETGVKQTVVVSCPVATAHRGGRCRCRHKPARTGDRRAGSGKSRLAG